MTILLRIYAGRSHYSCDRRPSDVRPPGRECVFVDGMALEARESCGSTKVGCRGTEYQHGDAGEIVVAQRESSSTATPARMFT